MNCVVASLSLHHVANLDAALDRLRDLLAPGGALVVVEWAWERFDEPTAQWCFARLAPPAPGPSRAGCTSTSSGGRPPDGYLREWATEEGLHPGEQILRGLDMRFTREHAADAPYLFADLADTSETEEQAAIDAGQFRPSASGTRPRAPDRTSQGASTVAGSGLVVGPW